MWLEIGAYELRILNGRYEHIVTHERKYGRESSPMIDFENYIGELSRKPRAFILNLLKNRQTSLSDFSIKFS